ncbi:MAG TPA: hypothetical protein VHG51_17260, partial [Longimicrobiaceae bacterium]|nr:hypothetical protein [Longimicrobiaceae bacterium]
MSSSSARHPAGPGLRDQIVRECTEMVRYALASGMHVPPALVQAVEAARAAAPADGADLPALTGAHGRLAKLVAPATPRALVLFAEEDARERGPLRLPGAVRLVRRMMLAALVSVGLFIISSLSPDVSHLSGDVLDSSGLDLLTNEVFWLASAGVGASFAMLFQVNEFIVNRSYDPRYESSYWVKFLIGVIAGFILVALVPVDSVEGAGAAAGAAPGTAEALARPTLAMLGGFSASAVYRILNRLMSTVEGLFRGDPREEAALREQTAVQRAAEEAAGSRLGVASQLVQLRQQIAAGAAPEEVSRQIAELVSSLVPAQEPAGPAPAAAPVTAG